MAVRSRAGFALIACCLLTCFVRPTLAEEGADEPPKPADLLALDLIQSDLAEADQTMKLLDRDDDNRLSGEEARRLRWSPEPQLFDINQDGLLTKLEIALHSAYHRHKVGITQWDLNNARLLMNRHDANKDRELSRTEVRDGGWPPEPEKFDINRDGILTEGELAIGFTRKRQAREELGITNLDQSAAAKFMRTHDANGDREIDPTEFDETNSAIKPSEFDTDKNERLSLEEIAAGFAKVRQQRDVSVTDQNFARIELRKRDRNGDDRLDINEIDQAGWPANPKEVDLDGDGFVTIVEVAASFAKERKDAGVTPEDQEVTKRLIGRYDRNRNGRIELAELDKKKAETSNKEESDEVYIISETTFVEFDRNFDSQLSPRELAVLIAAQRKKQK